MKYYGFIRRDKQSFQAGDSVAASCLEAISKCNSEDKVKYGYKKNLQTFQVSKLYEFATDHGLTVQEILSWEPTCIDAMSYLDYESKYGTTRKLLDCLVSMSDEKRRKITNLVKLLEHPHFSLCQEKDSNILSRELVAYYAKGTPAAKTDLQQEFVASVRENNPKNPPYDVRTAFAIQDLCDVPGKWLMCIPDDVSFYGYPPEIEFLLVQIKMLPVKYCDLVTRMAVEAGGE